MSRNASRNTTGSDGGDIYKSSLGWNEPFTAAEAPGPPFPDSYQVPTPPAGKKKKIVYAWASHLEPRTSVVVSRIKINQYRLSVTKIPTLHTLDTWSTDGSAAEPLG